jgi:hypothetical protein
MKNAHDQARPAAHRTMNVDYATAMQQNIDQLHSAPSRRRQLHPHPPQTVKKKR